MQTWPAMVRMVTVLAVLTAASTAGAQEPQGAAGSLDVGAVRFFRSAGTQTVVDAFCRVAFTL
ncbi:MAG: hypothetical protein ACREME_11530, partial [Gemmatimonadales bacterium]